MNRWRFQALLGINHNDKPKVFEQVFAGAGIKSLSYWLEIFFCAAIATFGLVENSPAVIIGAMLISPLMEPIMATGVALAVGDLYLAIKAVLNLVSRCFRDRRSRHSCQPIRILPVDNSPALPAWLSRTS